ncbi:hypothetical protein B0H11DRAFT_2003432, partial [Mycena galericulata]
MGWLGSTALLPVIHFPKDALHLRVRKIDSRTEIEKSTLKELVQSRCGSLFTPYRPTWWLFNGHLQTLFCSEGNFSKTDQIWYHRQ